MINQDKYCTIEGKSYLTRDCIRAIAPTLPKQVDKDTGNPINHYVILKKILQYEGLKGVNRYIKRIRRINKRFNKFRKFEIKLTKNISWWWSPLHTDILKLNSEQKKQIKEFYFNQSIYKLDMIIALYFELKKDIKALKTILQISAQTKINPFKLIKNN